MPFRDPETMREYRRKYRAANRDRLVEDSRAWRRANPDRIKALRVAYRAKKRETLVARSRKYREANLERVLETQSRYRDRRRDEARMRTVKWRREHPDRCRAQRALRRARKLRATPKWLTKDHIRVIELFYANCPVGYHVDHIHPLQGIGLCGLHVPWNLQYLPAAANMRKRNRLELGSPPATTALGAVIG